MACMAVSFQNTLLLALVPPRRGAASVMTQQPDVVDDFVSVMGAVPGTAGTWQLRAGSAPH